MIRTFITRAAQDAYKKAQRTRPVLLSPVGGGGDVPTVRQVSHSELLFLASSGTWTVGANDYLYGTLITWPKFAIFLFRVVGTTIASATPARLQIQLPDNIVAPSVAPAALDQALCGGVVYAEGTTIELAVATIGKGSRTIDIRRVSGANWSLSTDAQHMSGHIMWETQ